MSKLAAPTETFLKAAVSHAAGSCGCTRRVWWSASASSPNNPRRAGVSTMADEGKQNSFRCDHITNREPPESIHSSKTPHAHALLAEGLVQCFITGTRPWRETLQSDGDLPGL